MKKLLSTITILMLVTIIAQSSFAFDKKSQSGGQSNYKPKDDQPDPPEPKENPYIPIPLQSRITVSAVQWAQSSGEASRWNFSTDVINKTGKVIPKGALIEYTYSSNIPGYFQTNQGGKSSIKGSVVLKEALAPNAPLFLGMVVFVTTKNPANIVCTAKYMKKK
jgi:hypothetical protein